MKATNLISNSRQYERSCQLCAANAVYSVTYVYPLWA